MSCWQLSRSWSWNGWETASKRTRVCCPIWNGCGGFEEIRQKHDPEPNVGKVHFRLQWEGCSKAMENWFEETKNYSKPVEVLLSFPRHPGEALRPAQTCQLRCATYPCRILCFGEGFFQTFIAITLCCYKFVVAVLLSQGNRVSLMTRKSNHISWWQICQW